VLHIAVLAINGITNSIQSDVFNGDKLSNDGKITILENCDKVSDEQQKLCTDYKNKFGIK